MSDYASPISPGRSWYEDTAGERPDYPKLEGDARADVVIVGGGYTGLSAAAHLAENGVDALLVEAHRFGDGASGRNGGQLGTGQRAWAEELEAELGLERALALFAVAEEAKKHLLGFSAWHGIEMDYRPGQLSVAHRPRLVEDYRRHASIMAERFGYPHISYMDREETAWRTGSGFYHGGVRDTGTGHIHPLKLVIGLARAARKAGARLYENTKALHIAASAAGVSVRTATGTVNADKCLVAVNAHGGDLEPVSAAHIMPIGSFIGATEPLDKDSTVLPDGEAVDDSRFVIRYFRKSPDGRLLFGGREVYGKQTSTNIEGHIRRQIREIYPALADVGITHTWGGSVGITRPRKPFVRSVAPNVIAAGGYSGHGVMLANFIGRLYGEATLGKREGLRLFEELRIPAFPGGRRFRAPLLLLAMSWYALRDRI